MNWLMRILPLRGRMWLMRRMDWTVEVDGKTITMDVFLDNYEVRE